MVHECIYIYIYIYIYIIRTVRMLKTNYGQIRNILRKVYMVNYWYNKFALWYYVCICIKIKVFKNKSYTWYNKNCL